MNTLKVICADDHEIFRQGLIMAISSLAFVEVVGQADNGKSLLNLLKETVPDIILMDINMPVLDGIETTKIISKNHPSIKVVALSMFGDEEYLESMINAGAYGFILKNTNATELRQAITIIAKNQQFYSPELLPYFTNKYIKKEQKQSLPQDNLSKRELEILQLIAGGNTNAEMGEKLFISAKTVANHRANIIAKTGSKNTVTLLAYAIKNGLVEI